MEVIDVALVAIAMVCVLVLLLLRKTIGAYLSAKNDYREAARLLLNAKAALEKAIQDYRDTENELKETKAAYSILNMGIEQELKKSIEGDDKNGEVWEEASGGRCGMNDGICDDNRFEIIEAAKQRLIEATNIEMCPDEMAVLDSILFRMWQMGWLPEQSEPTARQSTRKQEGAR